MLQEVENNAITVSYTYGHDLIKQTRGSTQNYYLYDGLGSTRALTNNAGVVTDTYNYEAFGEVLNKTGSTENSYLFTGEQFDSGLDQYYLRARYYDQNAGRFTQQDTWMGRSHDPITLNKYLYANADPVMYTDPTGNFSIGSLMTTVNTAANLSMRAYSTYSNVTLLMDIAQGDVTLTELALTYAVGKLLPRSFFRCRNSFSGDMVVLTENGVVPISEVKIGDKVWAYDEDTGNSSLQEVIHLIKGEGVKSLVNIELQSGEFLTVTRDHTFFNPTEEIWIKAGDLLSGISLLNFDGNQSVIPPF